MTRAVGDGTGRGRRPYAWCALLVGALALTGCGIRPTQVPVDGGPAPSRVPCEVSGGAVDRAHPQVIPVRIYLVCGSQLVAVDRTAKAPTTSSGDPARSTLQAARAVLAELQREPSDAEQEAGFSTHVPKPMTIGPARADDPRSALRLSRQPEDLEPQSLSQLVCTLAENRVGVLDGAVLLGGPGSYAPRAYDCPPESKSRPKDPLPTRSPSPS
ncbi:hypothetical protein ACH4E8_03740 [Streptomyces sp. NPDC017979]|uniref:hypothetical protein n=1 Tax=unclassified Streptomyces TaxID=2593676 RepID=UPI0037A00826